MDSEVIITLEDYYLSDSHREIYIQSYVEFIGIDDLKYIFREFFNIPKNSIVGIYQKDFKTIYNKIGSYNLFLNKSGNYKLMEDIKLEISESVCPVGMIICGEDIKFNLNKKTLEICNLLIHYSWCIIMKSCNNCEIFNGRLKCDGNRQIFTDNCNNILFKKLSLGGGGNLGLSSIEEKIHSDRIKDFINCFIL